MYKRQIKESNSETLKEAIKAVSYTHLDVYKRQYTDGADDGYATLSPCVFKCTWTHRLSHERARHQLLYRWSLCSRSLNISIELV